MNLRKILIPIGWIYGAIMAIRNLCFKLGIINTYKSHLKTISVGNLSMGGTGKTPHVDFLINALKKNHRLSVLSRGYGRKTKGYLKATPHSSSETIGDEPLLYKKKHKNDIDVVVSENRVLAAKRIENTDSDIILLDDAYQHRKIGRHINILVTTYDQPYFNDFVVPAGNLREFRIGRKRADLVIVSKCPDTLSLEKKEEFRIKLKLKKSQRLYFSKVKYGDIITIGESPEINALNFPEEVLLVTGIAKPEPLEKELSKKFKTEVLRFPDHHNFTVADLHKIHTIFDTFVTAKKAIITTEKDFMRLGNPQLLKVMEKYPWYYQGISVEIDDEKNLLNYIENVNAD